MARKENRDQTLSLFEGIALMLAIHLKEKHPGKAEKQDFIEEEKKVEV